MKYPQNKILRPLVCLIKMSLLVSELPVIITTLLSPKQMVWASSNRIGCAIHTCNNMNVWGSTWRRAVYLVCNYAVK
ncbi:hypothetical protein JD844_018807 [Phrynosoma platyrhinos]|uniref:SCP domain-containing protein n=1 Tax=Phrynosoma platyrhinos TaxID=52577 RepID=A0ABQ7SP18_PHRPL|nr:hypothetical protein JD844_018807 [Phrynosoma platyrhinos]